VTMSSNKNSINNHIKVLESFDTKRSHILIYRKTPYLVPGTTLVFKKNFLKVVLGTRCHQKIFKKIFRSKNKVFGPVQIPKKTFFEFFSWEFLGDFVPVLKAKK
jgi:hypothetical protein